MHDDGPIPGAIVILVVFIFFYFFVAGVKIKSVTIIRDGTDTVVLNRKNSESPYFKLGAILTDSEMSLPETRIDNYFWLFEEDQYILLDGEVLYFLVKTKRPDIIIELSETPFESPP